MAILVSMGAATQEADQAEHLPNAAPPRPLDIVFAVWSLPAIRYFQSSLELLVERGHNVRLVIEDSKRTDKHGPAEQAWLERMLERPNFAHDCVKQLTRDPWHKRGIALRVGIEYINALGPAFGGRERYRKKALTRLPPRSVQRLGGLPLLRTQRGLRALHSTLAALERSLPPVAGVERYLAQVSPDLLVLGDYASRNSLHPAFARAAKRLRIPAATCVASWDNLTTRPRMRATPHRLVVWNETQRREALQLHGIPAERVVVTGAPNFDHWFEWHPRPREEFLARLGLDPTKPMVLWVAGALNSWEQSETILVSTWVAAIRAARDRVLAEANVLLRPHPYRLEEWLSADFSEHGGVAVWPRAPKMPIDADEKADYYDSIFHSSAVVGIITSAMIEAAIIGRPVFTVLDPVHHDSQLGALHHEYLRTGAVRVAETMEEHLNQLSAVLGGQDGDAREAAERFVASFVRPHGATRPATQLVVEALEQLGTVEVTPERDPLWIVPARRLIMLVGLVATPARLKRIRRFSKRTRRHGRRTWHTLASLWLAARVRSQTNRS
jgi:hypothetical protein